MFFCIFDIWYTDFGRYFFLWAPTNYVVFQHWSSPVKHSDHPGQGHQGALVRKICLRYALISEMLAPAQPCGSAACRTWKIIVYRVLLFICSMRAMWVMESDVTVPPPGDSCSLYMMMETSSDGRRSPRACQSITPLHQMCL